MYRLNYMPATLFPQFSTTRTFVPSLFYDVGFSSLTLLGHFFTFLLFCNFWPPIFGPKFWTPNFGPHFWTLTFNPTTCCNTAPLARSLASVSLYLTENGQNGDMYN